MREIDIKNEREFENSKIHDRGVRKKQSKFYWAVTIPTERHRAKSFEAIKDKTVLEIGCSQGNDAIDYAKYCEKYIGIDVSDAAIDAANDKEITNAEFLCTDGHTLPFDDESFDCVIVNSLLHHMDLEVTFKAISRVLKREGTLIFREPLGTNFAFKLYRDFTPSARTVDERPFTFEDLRLMKQYFALNDLQWFGFLNIAAAFLRVNFIRRALTSIDDVLSKTPIRYFYWQFSGVATKTKT